MRSLARRREDYVGEWLPEPLLTGPDVTADVGGFVAAARRPIEGAERVARLPIAWTRTVDFEATTVWLNGSRGSRIDIDDALDTAISLSVANGRITHIYAIRNPRKLAGPDGIAALTRS